MRRPSRYRSPADLARIPPGRRQPGTGDRPATADHVQPQPGGGSRDRGGRAHRRRRRRVPAARTAPALLLVAIIGWMLLWSVTNPAGAAPDEPSHYAKSVAAGRGELLGGKVGEDVIRSFGIFDEQALRQVRNSYRSFDLPAAVHTGTQPPCTAFRPHADGACLNAVVPTAPAPGKVASIVGAYPPWLYLPGGVLSLAADSVPAGYLLARLGTVAACAGLLAAGMWLLVAGRARQAPVLLAGFAVAIPPMVVFLGSQVGASGPEAAGAAASAAAILRLSAAPRPSTRMWHVAGVILCVTALTRPSAPLWVVSAVAVGATRLCCRSRLEGGGLRRRLCDGGWAAAGAGAFTAAGIAGSVAWTQCMSLRMPLDSGRAGEGLAYAVRIAPRMARDAVGVFGWQDVPLPAALPWLWGLFLAVLLVAAFVFGSRRDLLVVTAATMGTGAVYLALAGTVFYQNGMGMQGRYILPALVGLPLLAADVVASALVPPAAAAGAGSRRRPAARPATPATPATPVRPVRPVTPVTPVTPAGVFAGVSAAAACVIAATGVCQAVAWATNSRRYAVGPDGPLWFAPDAVWSPPGGWLWWTGMCVLLTMLTAFAALMSLRLAGALAPRRAAGRDSAPGSFLGGIFPAGIFPAGSFPAGSRPAPVPAAQCTATC